MNRPTCSYLGYINRYKLFYLLALILYYICFALFVISTCAKYSAPGKFTGTRFLAVNNVAMGESKDIYEKRTDIESAPDGFNSVHGVRKTDQVESFFVVWFDITNLTKPILIFQPLKWLTGTLIMTLWLHFVVVHNHLITINKYDYKVCQ